MLLSFLTDGKHEQIASAGRSIDYLTAIAEVQRFDACLNLTVI